MKSLRTAISKNICKRLLLKIRSWNWEKIKVVHEDFQQKQTFVFISWKKRVEILVFISGLVSFEVCIHRYFCDLWEYLLELIKRRSKVQEKNMPCEGSLDFDQWKTFSENCKPIKFLLQFGYKFTQNNCRSRLFSKFIQTQKRYPTSLDKIRILAWKLLVISS